MQIIFTFILLQFLTVSTLSNAHADLFNKKEKYPGCPETLAQMHSHPELCEIHKREWKAKKNLLKIAKLEKPERLADLLAPKLIDWSTWQSVKKSKNYEPIQVYEPAPDTWLYFEKALQFIHERSQENISLNPQTPRPMLSLETLKELHITLISFKDSKSRTTPGVIRRWRNLGQAYFFESALTHEQIKNIQNTEFIHPDTGKGIVEWMPTECWENLSDEMKEKHPRLGEGLWNIVKPIPANQFFEYTQNGTTKLVQCGYYHYPKETELEKLLALYFEKLEAIQLEMHSGNPNPWDPIQLAARAQKWFVSLHPFDDGNGRMSRLIMDFVLKSYELPTPLLDNLSGDLILSETEWTEVLRKGIEKTLLHYEKCGKRMEERTRKTECPVVPDYI